jgi:secreted Zn-dependent insulinase-like peptidase
MSKFPEDHPMSAHKDVVGQVMHRWKHGDPKPLHSGRGKKGKEGKIVKSQDQAIAIALSMAGKSQDHAERLTSMGYSEEVAQDVASMLDSFYNFATCERPNGSRYGTGGQCRKGSEVSAERSTAKKSPQATLDNLLKQEQEARDKGDTEKARKLMREHMNLVKELNSVPKKDVRPSIQQIQLERLQDRLDDAVTVKEQERISTAIKELMKRRNG